MKCVIIDSGININSKNIIDKKSFLIKNGRIIQTDIAEDLYGHGTACYHIINKYFQGAEYVILKITENGTSSILQLNAALEYCLTIECDVINISMSLTGNATAELENTIEKLSVDKNVKILSSFPNHVAEGYPASNKYVWGIRGRVMPNGIWMIEKEKNRAKDLELSVIPELTNRVNKNFYFFGGNSKATAVATALMMDQLNKKVAENDLFKSERQDKPEYLTWENYKNRFKSKKNGNYNQIKELLGLKNINEDDNLIDLGIIKPESIIYVVEKLEKKYLIKEEDIKFSDFLTIKNIGSLVERNGGNC